MIEADSLAMGIILSKEVSQLLDEKVKKFEDIDPNLDIDDVMKREREILTRKYI